MTILSALRIFLGGYIIAAWTVQKIAHRHRLIGINHEFMNIKKKRTKRLSPYGEHEIWEIKELQAVIKYEPHKRNKAILSLLWDLNGRNHEITLLRPKHIRLNERYG
jgi:hypothetical protein